MTTFGVPLLRFDSVSSTNDVAKELAVSGASEGLCVIATAQTAGRGRHGRSWSSPPGEGLYLSLVLRPQIKASASMFITLAAAVAVAETLRLDFQIIGDIKWPNDVLVKGRKICGILVEGAIDGDRLQYAVMGIGVNIAQRGFPEEIGDGATSLLLEADLVVHPDDFLAAMLPRLETWYVTAMTKPDRVIARWEELSFSGRDCRVRVESADTSIEGVTRGLTPSGALIVELASGERREIVSGEVKIRAVNS
ncbi:MAG TPA: biotin--[acetyl-CoA-carboxylase] ligase [Blastocatellia bacterium]|nr:biotin--[acetyl-CoA-carboxylase] ligase [Blastocatellia bacterium]